MSCEQFQDNYELYALGALEAAEANALAEHLANGCARCEAELKRAMEQNEYVSHQVPLVDPPARLRRRLQESIGAEEAPRRWLWAWGLAFAALLGLVVGLTLENRARRAEQELASSRSRELARLSKVLDIMQAPGTKQVVFRDSKIQSLHGSLYIHQKLGMALVIDSLPQAPAGWKYESWVVPKNGAPRPVEPFKADGKGRAVTLVSGPLDVSNLAAMAVSMEPSDAHPTKPTTLVFAARV